MTTDFRALCAELEEAYAWCIEEYMTAPAEQDTLIQRARAALAQPEPEGPTHQEIQEWADACSEVPLEELDPEVHGWRRCFTSEEFSEAILAALARWGRPTPQPPVDGEVAELVASLRDPCISPLLRERTRAADLLERLSPPQPVPTSGNV